MAPEASLSLGPGPGQALLRRLRKILQEVSPEVLPRGLLVTRALGHLTGRSERCLSYARQDQQIVTTGRDSSRDQEPFEATRYTRSRSEGRRSKRARSRLSMDEQR